MDGHPSGAAAVFVGPPARNLVLPGGQLGIYSSSFLFIKFSLS